MEFVALAWRPGDADAAGLAAELTARLDTDGRWTRAGRGCGTALWTASGRPSRVRTLANGRGFLVGELYAPPGGGGLPDAWLDGVLDADPETACRRLVGGAWGRYVLLFTGPEAPWRGFRDPSGSVDALAWMRGPVAVTASGIADLPAGFLADRVATDWEAVAGLLRVPSRAAQACPLEGHRTLRPGVLERLDAEAGITVWSPETFIGRPAPEPPEARRALVAQVDGVVAALAGPHRRLLVELSGGLDSAIVGTALAGAGLADRAVGWINYFDRRPAGDERAFARAAAARIGVPLTEVELRAEPLCEASFAGLVRGARPPVTATGRVYDTDMAGRAAAADATAILSGQGGDAAFFQMPTPLILADALRLSGRSVLWSGLVGDLARWTRGSAWSVWRKGRRAPTEAELPAPLPGVRAGPGPPLHPWVEAAADAPPAKRLQVGALAQAHLYAEPSDRRRVAEVLQPLFAQPVMELVLAIPAPVLAAGGRDRALAREAFASRLPPEVVERRSKGALGGYYGDVMLASLDWLRPHLLDGCLCDAGLIDRDVLASVLTPEHLAWRGQSTAVLTAALVESWVRWWQARAPDSKRAPRTAFLRT